MRSLGPQFLHQVVTQTVLAAALMNQLVWRAPPAQPDEKDLGRLIEPAVRAAIEHIRVSP